jgi:hypothetical protein
MSARRTTTSGTRKKASVLIVGAQAERLAVRADGTSPATKLFVARSIRP